MVLLSSRPMPTLFPPLELEEDEGARSHDGDGGVMSAELRENFEAMRALLRAQHRLEEESGSPSEDVSAPTVPSSDGKRKRDSETPSCDSNLTELEKRSESNEDIERRKCELAVATAIAVEAEISRLTGGIAELEALLGQNTAGNDAAAFPSLPSILSNESQASNGIVDDRQHIDQNADSVEKGEAKNDAEGR